MIACPACGSPTASRETRTVGNYVRRRRICRSLTCGQRVTTVETIVESSRRMVHVAVVPQSDLREILRLAAAALIATDGRAAVLALLAGAAAGEAPDGDATD